jgi:hypothetical protein
LTATAHPGPGRIRPLDIVLAVLALFALAISQPLLDLLGRNAEFFLARGAPPMDIVLLGLIVAVVIPLVVAGAIVLVARVHEPTGRVLLYLALTMFAGLLALAVIERTPLAGLPGPVEIALGLAAGAGVAAAFRRFETVRSLVRFAAVAPVVVLAIFLFTSSVSPLVFTASAIAQPAQVPVGNPAPVVMVVFDEFPVASLMDGDGNLQAGVYPNFARLAADGTWFRNAATVQQQTENSLPAVLTGNNPSGGKLPTANEYPANLFTLLADTYDIEAREAVTQLCPDYACENSSRPVLPTGQRWEALFRDLRIVAGHLFLPDDLAADLPPIDQSWSNFGVAEGNAESADMDMITLFLEQVDADRRIPVAQFLDGIAPAGGDPPLYFLHALLPHIPWTYLPSGQTYPTLSPLPGSVPRGWTDDEWLVDQAYQQHLLQVQYVDTIIGRLIDRLEETGLYDDALIVVLADHGVTVRPDIPHRRMATPETVGDIAAIPLLMKRPNDPGTPPDDYRAETIDVLPTIADVLDIDLPWETDGTSLYAPERPMRTRSEITGGEGTITYPADGAAARAIAARKIEHFGAGGWYGLTPPGQHDLLGVSVADLDLAAFTGLATSLRDPSSYDNVDLDGPSLPAQVLGTVRTADPLEDDVVLAVAVNGTIAAVTRSYHDDDGAVRFAAVIPPNSLVDGSNDVAVYLVSGDGATRTLARTSP